MVITDKNKINQLLTRAVDKIYPSKEALRKALESGKRLTVYHGIDPTGPQLHLGHSTNLFLLRKFQELGHRVILLVGDFTARIGDPGGKLAARRALTKKQVLANCKTYKQQAAKILDFKSKKNPPELKFNSQWLAKISLEEFLGLATNFTAQQILERDMFQERMKKGQGIRIHEFLYPLMQGYDSVAMDVDVEVGGTDQTFNMLVGRDLVKIYKNKEKFVITGPLLVNPKTKRRLMSKTEGGIIGLDDPPQEIYGKIMALPDEVITICFEQCTQIPSEEIKKMAEAMKKGANPRDFKARLAREIVTIYHNKDKAAAAEKEFNRIFREKEIPTEIRRWKVESREWKLINLLVDAKLAPSKAEARRLIEQGGVKIDKKVIKNWRAEVKPKKGMIIQVGKRKFIRLDV